MSQADQQVQDGPVSEQQQVAEATTGQIAQPRSFTPVDPANLDPRFDRDDLRQGHPTPAARKHLKMIKVRRNRNKKGTPYTPSENDAAAAAEMEKEADMTDDEVEVEDLPQELKAAPEEEKKPGFLGKLLGKDKEGEKE